MEVSKEAISVRIARLNQMLSSPYSQGGTSVNSRLSAEGLQDALLALYDECSSAKMKREPDVASFVEKFAPAVSELRRLRVKSADFETQAVIGQGNFGKVALVKEKATGHFYAMKTLPKDCSKGQKEASSYEEERDILALAARPGAPDWLPALQFAFQDSRHLYLVMEYLPGGDLLGLLDRFEGSLPEQTARFYLAEIVMAINSLHQLGYVHRDVKPDNVLLDRCGHIKLADFGSAAKINSAGRVDRPMPVGTPEYIAPEVLQSVAGEKGLYGVECDYWSLGIVAYELVYGMTPFNGAERTRIYSSIIAHEAGEGLEFPSTGGVSRELRALISGLLEPSASRLNIVQVKRHAFFSGMSWDTLRDSVPPYVPVVRGEADTSNFAEPPDELGESICIESFRSRQAGFCGQQLPFVGFTLTPGATIVKPAPLKQEEVVREVQTTTSKSEHPDIVRSREVKALREMVAERDKRLELVQAERREVETKLDHMTLKASNYRKVIEQERLERREVETKAVDVVKTLKAKWQAATQHKISELSVQLQMAQSSLESHKSRASELEGRLSTREEQLRAERENSDRLQNLLQQQKASMSKARRETLTFMGDAEQISELKKKLGVEEALKISLQEKNKFLLLQVGTLKEDLRVSEAEAQSRGEARDNFETLLQATQDRLSRVEKKLQAEQNMHLETHHKLQNVQAELSTSIVELERTRDAAVREELEANVALLEKQLTKCQAERDRLRRELEQANSRDEEQQGKVSGLELLLCRVEERLARLEEENCKLQAAEVAASTLPRASLAAAAGRAEVGVLQSQLERLEGQLEKAREAATLDKQACRVAEAELIKKEKELSNTRIDVRIAQRELKTSEEVVAMLREERAETSKLAKETEAKLVETTSQLEGVRAELLKATAQLERVQKEAQELRKLEEELQTNLSQKVRQLAASETLAAEKASLAAKLQLSLDGLRQEAESVRSQSRDTSSELNQLREQIKALEMNNAGLREACTMLDEQLEDSDKVRSAYEMQLSNGKQERLRLQGEVDKLQGDLRAKVQEAEELRALRNVAEEKLTAARGDAKFQAAEALEESRELAEQLREAREQVQQLLAQVNETEATLCETDKDTREYRHVIEALQAKCLSLQEEISATLTDLQSAREAGEALSKRLEASRLAEKETEGRLAALEEKSCEERAANEQKVLKMQATLAQQAKLIDFLQAKAEQAKKKRTLADKLFGSRPKENVAPSPSPLRSANTLSMQSARQKCQTWDCQPTSERTPRPDLSKTPLSSKVEGNLMKAPATPKPAPKPVDPTPKPADVPTPKSIPAYTGTAPMITEQRVLPEYCRLTINCAVQLSDQVVVLGTEEGLYSLHPRASGFQLVHIAGASKVKQIVTAPHLGLALIISGSPPELRQCELRALTVAAEAAQCSKPSLGLREVEHAPDQCHLCAVSAAMPAREKQQQPSTFLCVANPSHLSILRWNLGSTQFEPVRLLATAHPAASVLFTPHSLLLVCDDVFELDLQDFSVEEFLDMSDLSLGSLRAALKSRPAKCPVSLLDVTPSSARAEPEYMLCLPDIAVFLDGFGHRSRPSDLKWAHRPLAFVYRAPSLFVQYQSGVLEVKPNADKLCTKDDSCSTGGGSLAEEQGTIALISPKLLGAGLRGGSAIVSAQQASGATALITLGALGCDDLSLASDDTLADEFSFTSSLENSLEGDGGASEGANKKVQFA